MWRMVLRLTLVKYIYVPFVCCMYQLFIYLINAYESFYFEWDCRNSIGLANANGGGPSTVVLDDDECCATLYLELVSS